MKTVEKLNILDGIDDKFITEAFPHRLFKVGAAPKKDKIVISERHPIRMIESFVSVAAILLVVGAIFVWTLVGKDIINAYHGDNTTSDMTTTEPQTTPFTTTDNGIVPPIPNTDTTTPMWHTTTVPTTTTTPVVTTTQTPITTTAPITTTTPVTTVPTSRKDFEYFSKANSDEIIALYKENGCADDLLPSGIQEKVSENELDKIKAFFSDLTTLRFIPAAYEESDYFTPNDVDLHCVIMANFAPKLSEVTDEEKRLLPDSFISDTYKLTTAQLKELYKKYLGIDFDPAIHANGAVYLEAYDSYYSWGGGVEGPMLYFENICAWEMENGNIIVLLEDESGSVYFATLKHMSDSYIILQAFDSGYPLRW